MTASGLAIVALIVVVPLPACGVAGGGQPPSLRSPSSNPATAGSERIATEEVATARSSAGDTGALVAAHPNEVPAEVSGAPDPLAEARKIQDPTLRAAVHSYRHTFGDGMDRSLEELAAVGQFDRIYPAVRWEAFLDTLPIDGGKLAWKSSRDAVALLVMYEATQDPGYLERAWRFSLAALERRDDRTGQIDFKRRTLPVWGTNRYGDGRRTDFLVHSALILEPVLETLAHLEGRHPNYDATPLDVSWAPPALRDSMLAACLETIHAYDADYRVGLLSDEGYYVHSDEEGERERHPQPFNRLNVFAWDLVLAGTLADQPELCLRGQAVARFFRNRAYADTNGAFGWTYAADWPGLEPPTSRVYGCEDISHATATLEPIPKLARAGVVFTDADLGRFRRTLTEQVYSEEYDVFFGAVCGAPQFSPLFARALPQWLCLSEGSPEVYDLLSSFVRAHVAEPTPLVMAYLYRFRPN